MMPAAVTTILMAIFYFLDSLYMYCLSFFCKEDLSLLPAYIFNNLLKLTWTHIYFFSTSSYNPVQHYLFLLYILFQI